MAEKEPNLDPDTGIQIPDDKQSHDEWTCDFAEQKAELKSDKVQLPQYLGRDHCDCQECACDDCGPAPNRLTFYDRP